MAAETQLILQTVVKWTETTRKALNEVKGAIDGIWDSAKKNSNSMGSFTDQLKQNKEWFATLWIAAWVATYSMTKGIWEATKEATIFQNAMTGLKSIAEWTWKDFEKSKQFIQEFTKDGLITAWDAATSLKSLFQRWFSLEESIVLLNRFKDSASFGRQSALWLWEAVRWAAEWLKNENSMLVDNAWVTKNVAKMWEDYAAKIWVKTKELTKAQKREAEYQGIIEETKFQVWDAAKYAEWYAWSLAKQEAASLQLKQTLWAALMPAMTQLTEAITAVITPITQLATEYPNVSAWVILVTTAIVWLTAGLVAFWFAIWPITAALWALKVVFVWVWAILWTITLPIALVIAWLVALWVAIYQVWKHWDDIKPKLIDFWEWVKSFLSDAWEWIKKTFITWLDFVKNLWWKIWNWIKVVFEGIWTAIWLILWLTFQLLTWDFRGFLDNVKTIWWLAWTGMKDFLSNIWVAIQEDLKIAWAWVSNTLSSIWEWLKSLALKSWNWLVETIKSVIGTLVSFFWKEWREKIFTWFTSMFEGLWSWVDNIFNSIVDGIKSAINSVISLINSAITSANKIPGVKLTTIKPVTISWAREKGGSVWSGKTYLVGEKWPELFTAPSAGNIIPNNKLTSGWNSIYINFTGTFGQWVADEIWDMIVGRLQRASFV